MKILNNQNLLKIPQQSNIERERKKTKNIDHQIVWSLFEELSANSFPARRQTLPAIGAVRGSIC